MPMFDTPTPGPWFVKYCGNQDEGSACRISADPVCDASYEGVMYDGSHDECGHLMSVADARLMAAAPDLLAACKALQAEAKARNCGLRIADEAIAKAEFGIQGMGG